MDLKPIKLLGPNKRKKNGDEGGSSDAAAR